MIRFSPIGEFNDPFELMPIITPISRDYYNYILNSENEKISLTEDDNQFSYSRFDDLNSYLKIYQTDMSNYGVLCLSSNTKINQFLTACKQDKDDPRANILMWSHYADSHKGFVIEFKHDFIDGLEIKPVQYDIARGFLTFEDINDKKYANVFYKKSPEWAYEQEYRTVLPLTQASKVINENIHLFSYKKSHVNSITFGCAMSKKNKEEIMKLITNDKLFKNVKFNHARLDDEGFFLDFYFDNGRISNNPDSVFAIKKIPMQKKL